MDRRGVAFVLMFVIAFACGAVMGARSPHPWHVATKPSLPPLKEELNAITSHHARLWDARRADWREGEEKAQARQQWRKAYHDEMRDAYERRGMSPPEWLGE